MKTAVVHTRIEPETKVKAESVLRRLGITPTEAIRIFYTQISLRDRLPFMVEIPNKVTEETIAKSQRGKEITEFGSLDEMFHSWES
ncbi:MAG: type II toxin-antitoxin system RelB/DinJ family antitoxin [Deltaproteobacteria bacterium]|nr:type II toxin-antitoxin system RelB/DinJ family antitoxin [Deltaproteobacteria bacterium]